MEFKDNDFETLVLKFMMRVFEDPNILKYPYDFNDEVKELYEETKARLEKLEREE